MVEGMKFATRDPLRNEMPFSDDGKCHQDSWLMMMYLNLAERTLHLQKLPEVKKLPIVVIAAALAQLEASHKRLIALSECGSFST